MQTNEVSRCAYLYPVFCYIYEKVGKPLALIELGTSAGIQLLWDQYRYSYGTETTYGQQSSKIFLTSEVRGKKQPFLFVNQPTVSARIGIDLHINDLHDEEDCLWLQALIWPNHVKRRELFRYAAEEVRQHTLQLIEGDGVRLISSIVKKIDGDSALCIFHTHVANQLQADEQQRLLNEIDQIGKTRDVFHLYNNLPDEKLRLDYYINGLKSMNIVGETEGHGKWFTWNL